MAQYYAHVVDNIVQHVIEGSPEGRFNPDIEWIPCPKGTEIGQLFVRTDNKFIQAELSLDQEKTISLIDLKNKYKTLIDHITADYDQNEIITWSIQVEEAKELMKDEKAEAPFLTALATSRGIPLGLLVKKVLDNNTMFRRVVGKITGDRQRFEDRIVGCTHIGDLVEIRKAMQKWFETGGVA